MKKQMAAALACALLAAFAPVSGMAATLPGGNAGGQRFRR